MAFVWLFNSLLSSGFIYFLAIVVILIHFQGLKYIHAKNLVHMDIKPGKVILYFLRGIFIRSFYISFESALN